MGIKENRKDGMIVIEGTTADKEIAMRVDSKGMLVLQQWNIVYAGQEEAVHLWPILKRFAETEKIFEDRFKVVKSIHDGKFAIKDSNIEYIAFETKQAADVACRGMNEADRMENDEG